MPQGETEREYFNRFREVPPPYDIKAYYGRSVDFRDPFEKERYREWERKYREWYEKYYKGYAAGAQPRPSANRENFSPERFLPLSIRNSPFTRGRREDYSGGQSHRSRNIGGSYPEKLSTRDSHNQKDNTKSKEKESESIPGDGKGNKHKKHRKRRKGEENESFLNPELLESSRKPREHASGEENKTDSLFVLPSRDDATPVRDEPMDAESVTFKSVSEKDKREKDRPKAKSDKTKRKTDSSAVSKKENVVKPAKGSQEKLDGEREKSPRSEPPLKKVKEEVPKTDNPKSSSSQKDEKILGTPRKAHSKSTKEHQETKPVKEEKVKKEYSKDTKLEKLTSSKEEKTKKPSEKSKALDSKGEKRKRKTEEKSVDKDFESSSMKISKLEATEMTKPSPKRKMEPDVEKMDRTPEKDKMSSTAPAKKIKLNRETGKKIGSAENVFNFARG